MKKIVFIAWGLALSFTAKGQPVIDARSTAISSPPASSQPGIFQPVSPEAFTFSPGNHSVLAQCKDPNEAIGGHTGNVSNTSWLANSTAMTGAYTINKNAAASATNFISFTAAAQALVSNGVGGAVTITVVPNSGPYSEQVILPVIPGTSLANSVTFEGSGNTVSGAGTTANQGVFTFSGADFVKLNNLRIDADPTATVSCGVYFINASDNNSVTNCTINISLANQFMSVNGILAGTTGGNNANNLLLQNNIINGGYNGIMLTGTATTTGNRIIGNQMRDQRSYGIYIYNGGSGTIIEANDISRPLRVNGSGLYGVYLQGTTSNTVISKNRVHNTHDQASNKLSFLYAFFTQAATTPGNENIFKNNLVYNVTNTGYMYAFSNEGGDGTFYYHNSVTVDNPTTHYLNLQGLHVQLNVTNVKFINNIVSLTSSATDKHAIYLGGTMQQVISNNNDLFVGSSGNVGYYLGSNQTLAQWRTANGGVYDLNSLSVDPVFLSPATGNLQPTATAVYNTGQPLAAVTDDINGVTRSTTTPDIGAYEFAQPTNDAGITAIISPYTPVAPGSQPVQVTLKNFGSATLTSATIGWKVNGVIQPPFAWTGNLSSLQASYPVSIGNYNFPAGNNNICVWTANPGDLNKANDSTCTAITVCQQMVGNYTINKNNPTAGTNFQSISAAAARLQTCGVSGPVTITVAPNSGPYNEQVEIGTIPFTSATNTVTFEGSGNTVSATPGVMMGVFVLNGAKYVKLNNFILTLNSGVTAGWGVQLVYAADYNTISNNTINLPTSGIVANVCGIAAGADLFSNGNNTSFTTIQNNIINGGGTGIRLNGNKSGLNASSNQIINNQIKDSYYDGIFINNSNGILIEGNDISRPTLTSSGAFSGIYLFDTFMNGVVSKNRIHNTHDQITTTGLNVYGIQNNSLEFLGNNVYKNNLIYNLNCVSGNAVGIYNSYGNGNFFYHNTIAASPTSSYASIRGFYLTGSGGNVKVVNNNVSLPGATSDKYAIYLNGTGNILVSNNNNLYVGNNGYGFIGHYTGPWVTLAQWKAVNSNAYDQNSISVDPVFANPATGDFKPTSVGIANKGQALAAVTDDILGTFRNPLTPDPGAFEFGIPANDVGIIAVSGPTTTGCGLTASESITITLKNYGSATQTTIPVTYSVNGVAIAAPETYSGALAPYATAIYTFTTKANLATPAPYRIIARTVLSGDAIASNDADTLDVVNYLVNGMPVVFDFETPASGLSKFRKVVNPKSNITEAAGASNGVTSTKGLILDGVDHTGWITPAGIVNPWTTNPQNFAGAYLCVSPGTGAATDSLILTFDLKQLFKTANVNTNFRVTVNGVQVGPTYRPPFSGPSTGWQKVKVDLTAYLNDPAVQIGLESSVKEVYANGTGTANLIDNLEVIHKGITGMKTELLNGQLAVYPNPGQGIFNVNLPAGKTYELEITDLTGKVLKSQATAGGTTQLNLEGLAKGIYLLKVNCQEAAAIRKLIIE